MELLVAQAICIHHAPDIASRTTIHTQRLHDTCKLIHASLSRVDVHRRVNRAVTTPSMFDDVQERFVTEGAHHMRRTRRGRNEEMTDWSSLVGMVARQAAFDVGCHLDWDSRSGHGARRALEQRGRLHSRGRLEGGRVRL